MSSGGDTVTMYVSTGADKIKVSDYVGLMADQAQQELEELGFVVKVDVSTVGNGKEGTVLKMNPPGGQELKVGSTITLTVKQGSDSEEKTILTEKSFKLTDPKNDIKYSGGKVKLTVTINDKEETLETLDTISFPHTVEVS